MIPASKATPPRRRIAAHKVLFCTTSPVLTLDADFRLEPDPRLDVPLFRLEEPLPSEEEPSLLLPRELFPRVLFPSEPFPIEEQLLLFPLELLLLLLLSIVKHGAILHGAKVQVDSEYGKGTRMEIVFPEK